MSTLTVQRLKDRPEPAPRSGRKSLSGGDGESPQLKVRVPPALHQHSKELAELEGVTLSEFTRRALEEVVANRRSDVAVQRELHKELLSKLLGSGLGRYRDQIRSNLDQMRDRVRGNLAQRWIEEWESVLDGPPSRLVEVFLDYDEHSIDLRQVSPFAGILTEDERRAAITRARRRASL